MSQKQPRLNPKIQPLRYYIPFNCELVEGEETEFTLVVDEL